MPHSWHETDSMSPTPLLVDGVLYLSSAPICVQISSFYKDTSHTGLEPTLKTSF